MLRLPEPETPGRQGNGKSWIAMLGTAMAGAMAGAFAMNAMLTRRNSQLLQQEKDDGQARFNQSQKKNALLTSDNSRLWQEKEHERARFSKSEQDNAGLKRQLQVEKANNGALTNRIEELQEKVESKEATIQQLVKNM